jgi:coenzyme Q-binding protein COQ10
MPRHTETRVLPYRPEQMFDLVADIARYPEFLPWVIGARIVSRREREVTADLIVGFKVFRERFTSRVFLTPPSPNAPGEIKVDYVSGPLKYLHNEWRFVPHAQGTELRFLVDFQFKSRMFESLVGMLFTEAVTRMVSAFEKRAASLYGTDAAELTRSGSTA